MSTLADVPYAQMNLLDDSSSQDQRVWAAMPIAQRLNVLRRARHLLADHAAELARSVSPELSRTPADTLAAELLPLLEACRFLERNAAAILKPKRLGKKGLPFWLAGIDCTIERVPFGKILIIAPGNYPLFLPGVQTLQALAAGNSVVWKPGRGGAPVARLFAGLLRRAGLPAGLLHITGESKEDAVAALHAEPAKIFFTGSAEAGQQVARLAAETATPVVAELSGCDAVIVLPGAEPARVVDALAFGMRLNGSATCMAPRRLFLVGRGHEPLLEQLQQRLATMPSVPIASATGRQLTTLLQQADAQGAEIYGAHTERESQPILVLHANPAMELTQADLFSPFLSVMQLPDTQSVVQADRLCPFGLTAAIFGDPHQARALGDQLCVGTVLINDLIVPTADPRVPFGGRRRSGYGTTRGAEGLLEMTAAKVISTRTGSSRRHFQPTDERHEALFHAVIRMSHSRGWRERLDGLRALVKAGSRMNKPAATSVKDTK